MLKRVALSDVELGMFIHKMEGSWFKHPFWKSRFMLEDPDNLEHLRSSDLESVIIDTSKGKDVAAVSGGRPPDASPSLAKPVDLSAPVTRAAALRTRRSVDLDATGPATIATELKAAGVVADRAQRAVSKAFADVRLGKAVSIRKAEPLVEEIYASVQRNPHAFGGLMRCKLNNEFVYRHALSVSALMVSLARKMQLAPDAVREAGLAGLFLDIGTNLLPREAAAPNGDFSDAPPGIWRQHVGLGEKSLRESGNFPESVILACSQHHEYMNGSGFPNGLKGAEISLFARMAAICDTFDYLLVGDNNAPPLDPAQAVARLGEMAGAFDADLLRHFIESVGIYPVGSFVRLRSDRLAMIVDEDPDEVDKPVVSPFYSLKTSGRIRPKTIALARCYGEDEIVGIADLAGLELPEPEQLRELIFLQTHKMKK
ncbi:MAG: DUF3391 domain-containing protein [Novosphingobium sp.]|nr:DUF3391 domain-containing protein [Novosphingobium sp.]